MTFSWETPPAAPQRPRFSWETESDAPSAAPNSAAAIADEAARRRTWRDEHPAAGDGVLDTSNAIGFTPDGYAIVPNRNLPGGGINYQRGGSYERMVNGTPRPQPAPPQPRAITGGDAWLYNHLDALTLGNWPRIGAGGAAVLDTVFDPNARGVSYADLYRGRLEQAREALGRSRREHPLESMGGSLTGGVHLFALPGVNRVAGMRWVPGIGPALNTAAQGRGLGAFLAQSGLASLSGGAFGGVYGLSSAEEGHELEGLGEGARNGAMLGGLGPALFQGGGNALRWLWNNPALRTATGGVVGGGVGYIAPAENDEERTRNAVIGAGTGAALFGYGPNMFRSVRDMWSNAGRYAGQTNSSLGLPPPAATPSGAGGGRPGAGGGAGAGDEPLNPAVVRAFDDLAYETRQTPSQIAARLGRAQDEPAGRVWADMFDDAGAAQARALAQGRGTTTSIAREEAENRSRSLATRLITELTTRLGVRQTPRQAGESVQQAYQRISNEHYNPILNGVRLTDREREPLDAVLERLPPEVVRATQDSMQRVATMRGQSALQPGDARFYHNFYSALGQTIRNLERNPNAIDRQLFGAADLSAMRDLRNVFRNGLDTAIPGYRTARTSWAAQSDADDAIDAGRTLIASNNVEGQRLWRPEEVRDWLRGLTQFEREHVRVGVLDELAYRFTNASRAVGNANAANAFNIEGQQNILREVFDDPREAEAFIRILNEGNILQRNAQTWLGGSSTAANLQRAGRGWLSRGIEFAGQLGAPVTAARNAALGAVRALRENAAQQEDDAIGRALFSRIDDGGEDSGEFSRRLLAALRDLERRRIANAEIAGITGGQGAVFPLDDASNNLGGP